MYHHGPLVFKSSHLLGSPLTQGLGQQENTIKEITNYLEPAISLTPERRFSHAKEQQPPKPTTLATSDSLPKFHATNPHMARMMQPLVDISNTMNRSESSSRVLGMAKYNLPLQMPTRKIENSLGLRSLIDSSIAKLEMDHEKVSLNQVK